MFHNGKLSFIPIPIITFDIQLSYEKLRQYVTLTRGVTKPTLGGSSPKWGLTYETHCQKKVGTTGVPTYVFFLWQVRHACDSETPHGNFLNEQRR
jgi:hypothetical protein